MISSTIPSAKYSCSRSPLILSNGSTAIDGLSGSGRGLWCRSGASTHILHVLGLTGHNPDKAKALARNCANQPLLFTSVADRFARGIDASGQVRLGNETSGPNRVQQVILGDHALSILNQINQQIENLRPDGDLLGTSPKLAPVDIQDVVLKEKLHFDPPRVAPAILRPSQPRIGNFKQESGRFKGQLSAV